MKPSSIPGRPARFLATLAFLSVLVPAAQGAWYAKFDGVDGSSKHKDQGGWCKIVRFSNELTRSEPDSPGQPATIEFGDFVLVKESDKATPKLMQSCAEGTHLAQIEFEIVCIEENAAGEATPVCYLKYKLERCFIKSWSVSGDADERPTEELRITFENLEVVAPDPETPDGPVATLSARVTE